jgi:hypothetical protein
MVASAAMVVVAAEPYPARRQRMLVPTADISSRAQQPALLLLAAGALGNRPFLALLCHLLVSTSFTAAMCVA